jgi:ABC-type uncharacterized transport system permease subunit
MKISKAKLIPLISYGSALVLAFIIGGIFILVFTGKSPLSAYKEFFSQSFFSTYGILELLAKATPIIIAGAGMIIAFQCGVWNLGAEGQMAIGAIISTFLGLRLDLPGVILIPVIFLACFVGGAIWSGIGGYLKNRFGVHEILTTLMMNYIALMLLEYLISGPMSMPNPTYPRTSEIFPQAHLPFLKYPLNVTVLIAIAIIPIVWFLLNRTVLGYRLQSVGLKREAARFAGMNIAALTMIVMILSGGISALGGTVEILGSFFRMERNVTGGYGFMAIVVVMLARANIVALPFATSLTLAGISSSFSLVLIGLLLLCVVTATYIDRKIRILWED